MITSPVGGTRWNGYRSRHSSNAVRFLLGGACGSAIVGGVAAVSIRWVVRFPGATNVGLLVITIVCVAYAIGDLVGRPLRVPSRAWLVPRRWGDMGDTWYAITFGLVLGAGFLTVSPFIGLHVLVVWCALSLSAANSALVLTAFGVMRGLPVVLTARAVRRERSYSSNMQLGIIEGYASADRNVVRQMRIASLLGSGVAIIAAWT